MDKHTNDSISIGCVVGLYCPTADEHLEYRLVKSRDTMEYKPRFGSKISFGSKLYYENITQFAEYADDELAEDRPLAQALMGKRLGDSFKINEYTYRVEKIIFPNGQIAEEEGESNIAKEIKDEIRHEGVGFDNCLAAECTEEELQIIHSFQEFMGREFPQFLCESKTDKIVFYNPEIQCDNEQPYQFWFVKRGGILTFRFKLTQNESDELKYFNNVLVADNVQFDSICILVKLILAQSNRSPQEEQKTENPSLDSLEQGYKSDNDLFEELRICRLKKAQEEGVAAFQILWNRTLTEIVRVKPTNYEEWINIKGLGDATYKKIGVEFIEIIKKYADIKGEAVKENLSDSEEENYLTVNINGFDFICDENGEIVTDSDLLEELRKRRLSLAQEERVPAYCVFSNSVLVSLATYKPVNEAEWLAIKGLGAAKFAKYGEQIITLIKEYKR
ncbi:MAG: HRDC domain-containing protein [Clostridia bacterium]|nr:HRDC domain-containing protein [Clostridia bacterium]